MSGYQPSKVEMDHYGMALATGKFWQTILITGLFVTQLVMVIYGSSVFLSSPKDKRNGRTRFVVVSWMILLASGTDTILDLFYYSCVFLGGGPDGVSYLQEISKQWFINEHANRASDAMLTVAIALGDALMLWRCIVLWWNRKWVVVLPILAFIGSIICYIIILVPQDYAYMVVDVANIGGTALSVFMNIMITFLILWKLGRTWLNVSKALPNRKAPRMYTNVVAVIIESALPLALFGILYMIAVAIDRFNLPKKPSGWAKVKNLRDIAGALYCGFCALSPQMIIFRVTTGTSWKNSAETRERAMTEISQPIQFEHGRGTETKESRDSASDV